MEIRSGAPAELDHLARLWHDAWHDSHAALQPAELTRLRTFESFRERLGAALPNTFVAGPLGAPAGFYALKDDELYQLFVSPEARGSGLAAVLLDDAEARLTTRGVETAWLTCAIGNSRAARFYEKHGWRLTGTIVHPAETSRGPMLLDIWRFEKRLARTAC